MKKYEVALVPASIIASNLAVLATQVLLPRYLPPDEYTQYTYWWSISMLVASAVFEFARHGIIRYGYNSSHLDNTSSRNTLAFFYSYSTVILAAASLTSLAAGVLFSNATLISVTIALAISQALFDGKQALFRADLRNANFAISGFTRSILVVLTVPAMALASSSALGALAGMAAAQLLATALYDAKSTKEFVQNRAWSKTEAVRIAKFGLFVMLGAIFLNSSIVFIKFLISNQSSSTDAAGFLLAFDYNQKFYGVIGMLLSILLIQRGIYAVDEGTPKKVDLVVKRHISISLALIIPFTLDLYYFLPAIELTLVPNNYSNSFHSGFVPVLIFSLFTTFRAIGIDALFVIYAKPKLAFLPPLSLLATAALLHHGNKLFSLPQIEAAHVLVISSLASTIVSILLVSTLFRVNWPLRNMVILVFSACLMGTTGYSLDLPINQATNSFIKAAACTAIYCAALLLMNFEGSKMAILAFIKQRARS